MSAGLRQGVTQGRNLPHRQARSLTSDHIALAERMRASGEPVRGKP